MVFGFIAGAVAGIGALALKPLTTTINRSVNRHFPVELLNSTVYADAYRLGHISKEEYYEYCGELGLSKNQALLNFRTSDSLLTSEQLSVERIADTMKDVLEHFDANPNADYPGTGLEIIKRKYCEKMFEAGYTKSRADDIFKSLRPVPSFSIILEWLAKEAFEPEVVETFDLTADYPKIFDTILEGLEVPSVEREKYWIAHWNHLSNGQMVEHYQRFRADRTDYDGTILTDINKSFNEVKMTEDELAEALKLNELAPYWRARLQAITYRPLPFTLLQGAYQYGLEDNAWFLGRLKDYGYSAGNAQKIINFWAIKYPHNSRRPLSENIVLKLKRGMITKAAARTALLAADVPPDSADIIIGVASESLLFAQERASINAWKKAYRKKAITSDELDELIRAKITDAQRRETVKDLITREEPGAFTRLRISDIRRGYTAGNITEEQARAQMESIRMLDDDIDFFFQLYVPDAPEPEEEDPPETPPEDPPDNS